MYLNILAHLIVPQHVYVPIYDYLWYVSTSESIKPFMCLSIVRSILSIMPVSVFLYYLLIFPLSHLCTSFKHGKCQHPINGPISFCHRQPPLKNYQLPGTWLTPSPTETAKLEGPHMFHHPFLTKLGFRLSQVGVPPTPTSHHHPKGSAGLSFATQKTLCCRIHILGGV